MGEARQRKKENEEKQDIAGKIKKRNKKEEKFGKNWIMRAGSESLLIVIYYIYMI